MVRVDKSRRSKFPHAIACIHEKYSNAYKIMDTEQLKLLIDAFQNVGSDAKEVIIWYFISDVMPAFLGALTTIVCFIIAGKVLGKAFIGAGRNAEFAKDVRHFVSKINSERGTDGSYYSRYSSTGDETVSILREIINESK